MGHEINVRETVEDKKTWFNIKRFSIGGVDFNKPEKSLDLRPVDRGVYEYILKEYSFKFSEVSKPIPKFEFIDGLYQQTDYARINDFFSKRNWLSGAPLVLNFTLGFNPVPHMRDNKAALVGFSDYYWQFSNFILTVPNIRTFREIKEPHKPKQVISIASIDDYIKSVDFFYEKFDLKNHKPIFVPISVRMSASEMDKLVDHYMKKEYYYYWIDFEGRSINEVQLGALRHLFRAVKEKGYFDKTLAYFTNVRREIISNAKSETSPASDILCSLAGANLIGCDREPQRRFESPPPPPPPGHKARIFHDQTYYYVKTKDPRLFPPRMFVTRNAVELNNEFTNQAEFFMTNGELDQLLNRKNMLVKFRDGAILKGLMSKKEDEGRPNLSDYF